LSAGARSRGHPKELIAIAPDHDLAKLDDELERVKWYLWHGNVVQGLQVTKHVRWELEDLDEEALASCKLARTVAEFHTYIMANEDFIPNYGDRYRYGEVISTAFVESTVNQVISKRFVKKRQMRWTKKGAHLLLQVRAQVLNEDLRPTFERWHTARVVIALTPVLCRACWSLLHPWIVRRVGVHGRAAVIDRFEAQFVVPGFVAVDLAQPVIGAVLGQPRRGIEGPNVDRVPRHVSRRDGGGHPSGGFLF
jgi:hypothetical protein